MKFEKTNLLLKEIFPPILFKIYRKLNGFRKKRVNNSVVNAVNFSDEQDLKVYWNPEMAEMLETWGKNHVWNEIQMFLVHKHGKVLDIACGTGITTQLVGQNKNLEVYGCDISDLLISKAMEKGINKKMLQVCDATDMKRYPDNYFDYSYSIGSLEHFTETGILKFISEAHRITKFSTFHMVPVSCNSNDNGWIKKYQSYFNNSEKWWIDKFNSVYSSIQTIDSGWKDDISIGKWFACMKNNSAIF